jgi:hypothetical protein
MSSSESFFSRFSFLVVRFVFQAQRSGRLGPYLPPAIRGALGEALLSQQCKINPNSCWICEEIPYCALNCLFSDETQDEGPAPFVINTPSRQSPVIDAGATISFRVSLFGQSRDVFPALLRALEQAAVRGLQRGQIPCHFLYAEEIYKGTLTPIVENAPTVTLKFLTPVHIKAHDGILGERELDFLSLWRRLHGRLKAIGEFHCSLQPGDFSFPSLPKNIAVVSDNLRWTRLEHYSSRQRQRNSIGGLLGTITFAGELGPYLPYLRLGEITHVGSHCVVGLGKYRVNVKEDSNERSDQEVCR